MEMILNGLVTVSDRATKKLLMVLVALILGLFLGGCASSGSTQKHPVEDRAQQRWDALIEGDFDTAYSLLSPGYRSANSRVDFEISQRTRRVSYKDARVEKSDCSADACTVSTTVGFSIGAPLPGVSNWESSSNVQERWVRSEGNWWFVPDN